MKAIFRDVVVFRFFFILKKYLSGYIYIYVTLYSGGSDTSPQRREGIFIMICTQYYS